jgi:hypothetical protein
VPPGFNGKIIRHFAPMRIDDVIKENVEFGVAGDLMARLDVDCHGARSVFAAHQLASPTVPRRRHRADLPAFEPIVKARWGIACSFRMNWYLGHVGRLAQASDYRQGAEG